MAIPVICKGLQRYIFDFFCKNVWEFVKMYYLCTEVFFVHNSCFMQDYCITFSFF